MADIKAYRSKDHMLSSAQVFGQDKSFDDARLVVKEMLDDLSLQLVESGQVAGGVSVWAGYALTDDEKREMRARGNVRFYGGPSGGGSARLASPTSSLRELREAAMRAWDGGVSRQRLVHRVGVGIVDVVDEDAPGTQLDLFSDQEARAEERKRQQAINAIKRKFGKNAVLRGIDLMPGATARERHAQIGGHRSGEEE